MGCKSGWWINLRKTPESHYRVKVKIPTVGEESVWTRLSSFDAGLGKDDEGRGAFFRPEEGDEVIVGFFNDDPRQPVILGSMYNPKNVIPLEITEENEQKGIITREGARIIFDDSEKSILIETPSAENKITLVDEDAISITDENDNKITLNADGVQIESGKDIIIKAADGNIELEGKEVK